MKNPKELERKTNRQLVKLRNEEDRLTLLQSELTRNPKFVEFLEIQKQLQKKTDEFWDSVKKQMINKGINEIKIDNDFMSGKLSTSYVKGYEATNIDKVNKKFITKALDIKKVAAEVEANGELPSGVDEKGYYRLNKTLKSKDVVS